MGSGTSCGGYYGCPLCYCHREDYKYYCLAARAALRYCLNSAKKVLVSDGDLTGLVILSYLFG